MRQEDLSVEVLGRINMMQSMVTQLPDQKSILQFIAQGFSGVAGIRSLRYEWYSPGIHKSTEIPVTEVGVYILTINHKQIKYADLFCTLESPATFEAYSPFLKNFVNMLGVVFQEKIQRDLNKALMMELEQRVIERTRELESKKEDLRITLNSIGDGVISTDVHGCVAQMNPMAAHLTGWAEQDARGKPLNEVFDIVNATTSLRVPNPVERVLHTGEIVGLANHTTLIARSGLRYQIADSAAPIRDRTGTITGVVLVFRDISEDYRSAEALRISEERYRAIVEETSDLIISTDAHGVLTFVNRYAEHVFGLTVSACMGKSAFSFIHPDDSAKTRLWFDACTTQRISRGTFENRQVNITTGAIFHFLWTCNFIYNDKGQIHSINSMAHDITDRKHAEESKLQYERQLNLNQKLSSLGVLAGGIAHDFNNLMGGLFGYLDLAMAESTNACVSDYLEKALTTIGRARNLTSQLLTFAKGGSPTKRIEPLFPFLLEAAQFALSGSNVICQPDVSQDLLLCDFDKHQIGQVIDNLVINSKQAMSDGGIIHLRARNINLSAMQHGNLPAGMYIEIAVEDHGCGISGEILPSIFDPFFTTKVSGHGLGLATCYSIIKQHNGHIDVKSTIGIGSTFTVYLPATAQPQTSHAHPPEAGYQTSGKGLIIIMDDEQVLRETVAAMLSSLGYHSICFTDGNEVIEKYPTLRTQHTNITALIVDLTVPGGMGGLATLKAIRAMDTKVPVFVMSGYANDPIMRNAPDFGFTGSLKKPFLKKDLAVLIGTPNA